MKSNQDKFNEAIAGLFPNHICIYELSGPRSYSGDDSLLHQHFHEPLLADKQQQLVMEIAGFLSGYNDDAVYSYFYRANNSGYPQPEWQMATARLKKNREGLPREVVIFTYNLQLLGEGRKKLYRVLEDDGFFKTHYNQVSLLTKREKEIIGLLTSGSSSAEIADKLFVSVHTINTHRKSINNKLAIKNMADILRIADVFDLNVNQPNL